MIIKNEPESEKKTSMDGYIVNSKRAIYFTMGFVGWFAIQAIYTSFAVFTKSPLIIASLPINIIAIVVILKKLKWIGFGVGIAFSLNLIVLVSMGVFGLFGDEGVLVLYMLFPPFFLLFIKWYPWLLHL